MLERQQNLKRLSITAKILGDPIFQTIERKCKNVESLKICCVKFDDDWPRRTNVRIANGLIIKNMVIKQLRTIWNGGSIYFPRTLIKACKELVSLNMEGRLFHFAIYNYICVYNWSLQI